MRATAASAGASKTSRAGRAGAYPAGIEHRHPVGTAHRLLGAVRHVHDGGAEPSSARSRSSRNAVRARRVQGSGRLVEQQHVRLGGQRPGQVHPLPLPAGQPRGRPVGEVRDAEPAPARCSTRRRSLGPRHPPPGSGSSTLRRTLVVSSPGCWVTYPMARRAPSAQPADRQPVQRDLPVGRAARCRPAAAAVSSCRTRSGRAPRVVPRARPSARRPAAPGARRVRAGAGARSGSRPRRHRAGGPTRGRR